MADGSTKPIETIEPGDMVLAVDHNDPENDTPKPAKVTRFFDNGLKDVVKLIFENQDNKERFEVVCSPSHRFYSKEKGWTTVENLHTGDKCTSANGTEITFLSREELQSPEHVYNFEVEEKHTYFVGRDSIFSLLVHNQCSVWGIVDSCLGVIQGAGEFVAGGSDNLTFGLTQYARDAMWGKELSKIQHPNIYLAGEITETVVEIGVTGGSAILKNAAKKAVLKEATKIAIKAGTEITPEITKAAKEALVMSARKQARRVEHVAGKQTHHVNTLLGHPAIKAKRPYKFLPGIPSNTTSMFQHREPRLQI